MASIFYLSHKPAVDSNKLSKGITKKVVETVEKIAPEVELDISRFNHLLRKNAHFFAYLVLGVLVVNALRFSGIIGYRAMALGLFICVIYAISDEVHQIFVPGRGCQVKDVIIDSAGAFVGILSYNLIYRIKERS